MTCFDFLGGSSMVLWKVGRMGDVGGHVGREDKEFEAKSFVNKGNRGNKGTHVQGNRDHSGFKGYLVYIWNKLLSSLLMFFFVCITFVWRCRRPLTTGHILTWKCGR
jgi:hypothetical protein